MTVERMGCLKIVGLVVFIVLILLYRHVYFLFVHILINRRLHASCRNDSGWHMLANNDLKSVQMNAYIVHLG